jgi:hypothetical protein
MADNEPLYPEEAAARELERCVSALQVALSLNRLDGPRHMTKDAVEQMSRLVVATSGAYGALLLAWQAAEQALPLSSGF